MTEEPKLPEGQSQQSPSVLISACDPQREEDDPIDWAGCLGVIWRRKLFVLLVPLLFALTACMINLRMPPTYRARATLILQPPEVPILRPTEFLTGLKPVSLSVKNLNLIIESDLIADKLSSDLLQKSVVEPETSIEQIKDMLSVELPSGDNPRINLVVEMGSPEKAKIIANTWAQLSLVEIESQYKDRQQASANFIESRYRMTKDKLIELETELAALLDNHEVELTNLQVRRQAQRENLDTTRSSEMNLLEHEQDLKVAELKREIGGMTRVYELMVGEKFRTVELARQPDVKIEVATKASERPRQIMLDTLIALAVGFILSVMLAFALENAQAI